MRISAVVEVSNRTLPTLNIGKRRPEKSYLSIGYTNKEKDKIFVLHQTVKNNLGVKYKVFNNVASIFEKFLAQGKATIRFVEPPVDLVIKGDPNQVKNFLQLVKTVLKKDKSSFVNCLSNLHAAPTKVVSEPSNKLIITKSTDFRLPQFPRNLEHLKISSSYLTKFDNRILRLQKLRVLNLEDNSIEDIPAEIELLPVLEELHLAKNQIGKKSTFTWLKSSSLRLTLRHLDLRENQLKYIPREVCRLKNLKTLLLDNNFLRRLPPGIGRLTTNLRNLGLSNNKLKYIPASIRQFKNLHALDVSNNEWKEEITKDPNTPPKNSSLLALAATAVLRNRIEFSEEILPRTLIDYLEDAGFCYCRLPVFPESPNCFMRLRCFVSVLAFTKGIREEPVIGFTSCLKCLKIDCC